MQNPVSWKPLGKASGEEVKSLMHMALHGIATSCAQDVLCHPKNQQGNTGHSQFLEFNTPGKSLTRKN